jgi:hypothetical protein
MDKGVGQRFTQSFMDWSVINPRGPGQFERHLEIPVEFLDDHLEKIVEVTGPGAIGRDPVNPPGPVIVFRSAFLIIDKVMRDGIEYGPQFPEHQKAGESQTLLSGGTIPRESADGAKEFMIIKVVPRVSRFGAAEPVPVGTEGVVVQVRLSEVRK